MQQEEGVAPRTTTLLDLPLELREHIYTYCISYPDLSSVWLNGLSRISSYLDPNETESLLYGSDISLSPPIPLLKTPSILLVNRRCSREALRVLRRQWLILKGPPHPDFEHDSKELGRSRIPSITLFVARETLQAITRVKLEIHYPQASAYSWHKTIAVLLDTWKSKNSLEMLEVRIKTRRVQDTGYMEERKWHGKACTFGPWTGPTSVGACPRQVSYEIYHAVHIKSSVSSGILSLDKGPTR